MFTKIMKLLTALCLSILAVASVSQAQSCAPAPIGLISWWMADGNALDARSGANGTLRNGATFGAAQVGQAFIFDGIDDSVDTSGSPISSLNFNANDFTIEAWVKTSSTGTIRTIYGNGYNLDPVVLLRIEADNRARLLIRDNAGTPDDVLGTTTTLNDGSWHHIAGVRQGTTAKLFVDGVLENSVSNSTFGSINSVCDFAFIGGFNSSGVCAVPANEAFFNGSIDEVSVYNRALSQPEIQTIFNAGTAGKCKPVATIPPSGIVAWWPGDGNADDISGNGNNGTLVNGTTFATGEVGQAFSLDGVNDQINITHTPTLDFGHSNSFSVEAWLKPDVSVFGSNRFAVSLIYNCTPEYIVLLVLPNGTMDFAIRDSNGIGIDVTTAGSILDGQWHHFAGVRNTADSTVKLYMDGVEIGSLPDTTTGSFANGNPTDRLGSRSACPTEDHWLGSIDEVTVYNRAITPDEITSIFNAGAAGKQKPLAPTAAHVGISGRVMDRNGNGLARSTVLVSGGDGARMSATTNSFGYYEVTGLVSGLTYILSVKHKGYTFEPRPVTVTDDLLNVDFVPLTNRSGTNGFLEEKVGRTSARPLIERRILKL